MHNLKRLFRQLSFFFVILLTGLRVNEVIWRVLNTNRRRVPSVNHVSLLAANQILTGYVTSPTNRCCCGNVGDTLPFSTSSRLPAPIHKRPNEWKYQKARLESRKSGGKRGLKNLDIQYMSSNGGTLTVEVKSRWRRVDSVTLKRVVRIQKFSRTAMSKRGRSV